MGKRRAEIKKIENKQKRAANFYKRRNRLMKKARELSVLCDAEIAVIVFSRTGRRYEFSSSSMQRILSRYNSSSALETPSPQNNNPDNIELERLLLACKKPLEDLDLAELQSLDDQLTEASLSVKNKKMEVALNGININQTDKTPVESEAVDEVNRRLKPLAHEEGLPSEKLLTQGEALPSSSSIPLFNSFAVLKDC